MQVGPCNAALLGLNNFVKNISKRKLGPRERS